MTTLTVTDENTGKLVTVDIDSPSGNLYVRDANTGEFLLLDLSSPDGTIKVKDAKTGEFVEVNYASPTGTVNVIDQNTGEFVEISLDSPTGNLYCVDDNTGELVEINTSTASFFKAGGFVKAGSSDTTSPTVVITCAQASPTAVTPLNYTITFSEDVTGFTVDDLALTIDNGTVTKSNFTEVSASVYTVDGTPSFMGNVKANIAAGVAIDGAGNENTAAEELVIQSTAPYTFDPSALSDGALPLPWVGSTYFLSGGKIYNSPSIGANVLTDPGLEATYTAGKCATLTMTGSPTVAEITSGQHQGSKAQEFLAVAQNNSLHQSAGSRGPGWWRYSRYARRTAGSALTASVRLWPAGGTVLPTDNIQNDWISEASWKNKQVSALVVANSTLLCYLIEAGTTGFSTIQEDDGYLGQLTTADLFALLPAASRLATVKMVPGAYVDATHYGLIAWYSDANNYLMALLRPNGASSTWSATLIKVVGGTPTSLINSTAVTYSAGAWLEIRPVDNDTVALYYNNSQVSTNKDVADVPGSQAGLIVTGGNVVQNFFMG